MTKILGIDTSNYTTSIAVVEDNKCILDSRKLLEVKIGERGLRQSEALFQHINNLPRLLNSIHVRNIDGVSVSVKPRPLIKSYMPVFKGGESIARSLAYSMGIKIIETTHQEGHIEAATHSIDYSGDNFIAFHLSGGTTEVLKVSRGKNYNIEIIGGTRDISAGQFIDRIGVAMGYPFPCGETLDAMAVKCYKSDFRIPSKVDGLNTNFSGVETLCLKYIKEGHNQEEIAFGVMLCIAKTLEKIINNLFNNYSLPIIFMGGVACSQFLRSYLGSKFGDLLYFSKAKYASDNAVGVAYIGYKKLMEGYD